LRYLIYAVLAATVWLLLRGMARGRPGPSGQPGSDVALVEDPVCKTHIPKSSAVVVHRSGKNFYFCSERCAAAFRDAH